MPCGFGASGLEGCGKVRGGLGGGVVRQLCTVEVGREQRRPVAQVELHGRASTRKKKMKTLPSGRAARWQQQQQPAP